MLIQTSDQVKVRQLLILGALAQHHPLELQEDRKTKEDQEQTQKVFLSNPTYLHNL